MTHFMMFWIITANNDFCAHYLNIFFHAFIQYTPFPIVMGVHILVPKRFHMVFPCPSKCNYTIIRWISVGLATSLHKAVSTIVGVVNCRCFHFGTADATNHSIL